MPEMLCPSVFPAGVQLVFHWCPEVSHTESKGVLKQRHFPMAHLHCAAIGTSQYKVPHIQLQRLCKPD